MVGGHDRGGRVAYRLALDHPEAVRALIPIDILPTAEMWRRITAERAISGYHWQFLAQPYPLPETLIGKDPVYYLEHTLKSWTGPRDLSPFSAEALAHYRALLKEPARVHAVCEDYRAGAGIDRQLDEADLAAGRKIACPTFVLWGSDYLGRGGANPLEVWRTWCTNVDGAVVKSGHFLAEENPQGHAGGTRSVSRSQRGGHMMAVIPAEGVSPRAGTQGRDGAALAPGSRIFAGANSGMTARSMSHDRDRHSPAGAQAHAARGAAVDRAGAGWRRARAGLPTS